MSTCAVVSRALLSVDVDADERFRKIAVAFLIVAAITVATVFILCPSTT
jgi:hypothetical protein